jgi:hypothetical protein
VQQSTDKALPENSREHLDQKLDHAIKETFPTSDPVSVSVTKGSAIDYPEDEPASSRMGDWREMQRRAASQAADFAQEAAERGRDAWQKARGGYAQAEDYLRRGTRSVQEKPAESLVPVLIGFGIGFAVAWAIKSRQSADESDAHVSEFARKRTSYMPR